MEQPVNSFLEQDALAVSQSQRCYEETEPNFREVSVKADETAIRSRRIVADMVAAEE